MTTIISTQTRIVSALTTISAAAILALALILPSHTNAALLTQELELGSTGAQVTALQTFLSNDSALYPEGLVTGYFGPLTEAAVKRYQTRNGITAVGRVGPVTLASINANSGTGGSDDVFAPTIYPEAVSVSSNSATISWTVGEAAKNRVMYGTSWPFLYSSAPSVSSNTFGSTANITLSGLQSHTTYYYVLESIDGPGNIMWTVAKSFRTQ